jgi:hypothetical protein
MESRCAVQAMRFVGVCKKACAPASGGIPLAVRVVRPRNRKYIPLEHGGLFSERHAFTKGVAGVLEGDSVRRGFVARGEGKLPRLAVVGLNHVSIETDNVSRLREFYAQVVGLQELKRPDFGFGGAWLRLSSSVALHIIQRDPLKPEVCARARGSLSLSHPGARTSRHAGACVSACDACLDVQACVFACVYAGHKSIIFFLLVKTIIIIGIIFLY